MNRVKICPSLHGTVTVYTCFSLMMINNVPFTFNSVYFKGKLGGHPMKTSPLPWAVFPFSVFSKHFEHVSTCLITE